MLAIRTARHVGGLPPGGFSLLVAAHIQVGAEQVSKKGLSFRIVAIDGCNIGRQSFTVQTDRRLVVTAVVCSQAQLRQSRDSARLVRAVAIEQPQRLCMGGRAGCNVARIQ